MIFKQSADNTSDGVTLIINALSYSPIFNHLIVLLYVSSFIQFIKFVYLTFIWWEKTCIFIKPLYWVPSNPFLASLASNISEHIQSDYEYWP